MERLPKKYPHMSKGELLDVLRWNKKQIQKMIKSGCNDWVIYYSWRDDGLEIQKALKEKSKNGLSKRDRQEIWYWDSACMKTEKFLNSKEG